MNDRQILLTSLYSLYTYVRINKIVLPLKMLLNLIHKMFDCFSMYKLHNLNLIYFYILLN